MNVILHPQEKANIADSVIEITRPWSAIEAKIGMRWLESKFSKQTTKTYLRWLYRILGCLLINSPLYGCVYRDVCEEQTIDSQTQNFRCSDAWVTFYREGEVDDVICQRYVLAAYSCTMLFEPKYVDVHVKGGWNKYSFGLRTTDLWSMKFIPRLKYPSDCSKIFFKIHPSPISMLQANLSAPSFLFYFFPVVSNVVIAKTALQLDLCSRGIWRLARLSGNLDFINRNWNILISSVILNDEISFLQLTWTEDETSN